MNKRILSTLILAAFGASAWAKLPPPDEATKAKAAETTAKAAWQAKVDAWQLCKSQDKVASKFRKAGGGNGGDAKATQVVAKPAAVGTAAAAANPAAANAATPAAPCADPGPFAYNPPEQKPLETSGAHSPTGTSGSPPSVRPEAATMTPGSSKPAAPAAAPAAPAAAPAKKS